jgi:hypothetical protein
VHGGAGCLPAGTVGVEDCAPAEEELESGAFEGVDIGFT